MSIARIDALAEDHGSIALVRPYTAAARAWLLEHTDGQWFGHRLVVEPRYLEMLLEGMESEGFTVSRRGL